jgi:peptide methionine sulfoxide reductase MsrA
VCFAVSDRSRDDTTDEQRRVAEETILDVDASGHWPGTVVTEISECGPFWGAEAEDQNYFLDESCHSRRPSERAQLGDDLLAHEPNLFSQTG